MPITPRGGGPRRCPAHARAQLQRSLGEVEELERREALLRDAIAVAMDTTARSHGAACEVDALGRELDRVAAHLDEDPESAEYWLLREELAAARDRVAVLDSQAREAVQELGRRRREAVQVLVGVGVSAAVAGEHLDSVERETGFAPPFI